MRRGEVADLDIEHNRSTVLELPAQAHPPAARGALPSARSHSWRPGGIFAPLLRAALLLSSENPHLESGKKDSGVGRAREELEGEDAPAGRKPLPARGWGQGWPGRQYVSASGEMARPRLLSDVSAHFFVPTLPLFFPFLFFFIF